MSLPLGAEVATHAARLPERLPVEGSYVTLEPLDPGRHGGDLWDGLRGPENDALWAYLFQGAFHSQADFDSFLASKAPLNDPLYFAIVDQASGRALGLCTFMRIDPANRVIEIGSILFTPALQRTRGATEAMYLMARRAFDELGYRRYEWKCNALNEASRRAALRLGFRFEGIFRQHMIVKGRNRDTAWFSMLDSEWPQVKAEFERWLAAGNFDEAGGQRSGLRIAIQLPGTPDVPRP